MVGNVYFWMTPDRRHWVVVNIPGIDFHKGDVLAPYMGPAPPPHSGYHRYVFAVFQQQGKIDNLPKWNK
jgi:phosphatidylethanolamine-binding protein (PEBP) family uncharacterized protein